MIAAVTVCVIPEGVLATSDLLVVTVLLVSALMTALGMDFVKAQAFAVALVATLVWIVLLAPARTDVLVMDSV